MQSNSNKTYSGIIHTENGAEVCRIIVDVTENGYFETLNLAPPAYPHFSLLEGDESGGVSVSTATLPLADTSIAKTIINRFHGDVAGLPHVPFGNTAFLKAVYEKLYSINYGSTMTYQELAHACGNEKAARAVGNAMKNNPLQILFPCHRVVGKAGLGGFAGKGDKYIEIKRKLLEIERSGKRIIIA